MDFVYPRDFIPIGYHIVDSNSMFLVQNCAAALEHLCQNKLTVFDVSSNFTGYQIKELRMSIVDNLKHLQGQNYQLTSLSMMVRRDIFVQSLKNFNTLFFSSRVKLIKLTSFFVTN